MPNGDTLEVRVGTLEKDVEVIKAEHRNCRQLQDDRYHETRSFLKGQDRKLWGIILLLGGLVAVLIPLALKSL